MVSSKNVYSVCQVNSYIKNMFTQDFMLRSISVRGELSNVKFHNSGHIYFTLKDEKGSINCVMFASNRSGLKCELNEGLQVVAKGSVDVYERDGKYQLYVKEVAKDGIGALYERFLMMKQQMEEMGMFAEEYKRPIPRYIKRLGVVTAQTGAAVQDIINVSKRRNPFIEIIVYPAIVQGQAAPQSIVKGIKSLENFGVDVMIVGRGGGSMEDLWAFNEEIVAQAIFDCTVPIISAVGHETDFTIADYVADLRAPTPSAAAEQAVCEMTGILQGIDEYEKRFSRIMEHIILMRRMKLHNYQQKLENKNPAGKVRENRMRHMQLVDAYQEMMEQKLLKIRHKQALLLERYKGASPLNKLGGGYSYVSDSKGRVIKDSAQVEVGDCLSIQLYKGKLITVVKEKE